VWCRGTRITKKVLPVCLNERKLLTSQQQRRVYNIHLHISGALLSSINILMYIYIYIHITHANAEGQRIFFNAFRSAAISRVKDISNALHNDNTNIIVITIIVNVITATSAISRALRRCNNENDNNKKRKWLIFYLQHSSEMTAAVRIIIVFTRAHTISLLYYNNIIEFVFSI